MNQADKLRQYLCDCGTPAVTISNNAHVCANCARIEKNRNLKRPTSGKGASTDWYTTSRGLHFKG